MAKKSRPLFLRVLSRLLAPGRGEVRALEEAMHLQGVLRFVAVIAATIVGPSLVLAYFAVHAISVEELAAREELSRTAEGVAQGFWRQVEADFSAFEEATLTRLEAGRSPLERAKELHPLTLVSLRFDADGVLIAPFSLNTGTDYPKEYLFHPDVRAAAALMQTDPAAAAQRYGKLARQPLPPAVRARAELDRALLLETLGRQQAALVELDSLILRYPDLRDSWGFRISDLARLQQGEIQMRVDQERAIAELRELVDDLLKQPWTVGQGSEAAVASQALSMLVPHEEQEWITRVRGQIAERNDMLYWTGELLDEIRHIPDSRKASSPAGELWWYEGERGMWAVTRWGGGSYAFGLDRTELITQLKTAARASTHPTAPIEAALIAPDELPPEHILAIRSLDPWLANWSVVTTLRDPEAIAAENSRKRTQRIAIIGFAIAMMGVGAVLSARLISRELDVVRMKTDFAANVSHELRSPITQIRLKAESLILGLAETPEEIEQHYNIILRESERLSRLVDNILDYAAIERGSKQYMLRIGNIAETVDRAIESVRSTLELKDIELILGVPYDLPLVHHDTDAITQCIVNLVSNAAKYSPGGSKVRIHGRLVEGVELTVSDEGIGIAAHDLQQIFEPFYRSRDEQARRQKGTGIGLTITRYIIEAHGGSISVQSRPGKGSTFTLSFPTEPPPPPARGTI
ncbi:MAG: signal transduction histidine kinase [Myxococcota bacterium]|jgi:signal transduction histidine kinase